MLTAVQRSSLVSRVCEALRRAIGNREWVDVLPPERELCARLQVSRKTLRAALALLHREQWVEVRRAKRTRVIARRNAATRHGGSKVLAVLYPEKALHTVPFNLAQFRILQLDWRAARLLLL